MNLRLFLHINRRNFSLKNQINKSCFQCKHFIPPPQSYYPHETVVNDKIGKCSLFSKKDILGNTDYELAVNCRSDNEMCGSNGDKFELLFQNGI